MSGPFEGRAAIITGASSGIGRAVAVRLGAERMRCWLVGRSAEGLAQTASAITDTGGPAAYSIAADLTEQGALSAIIEAIDHPYLFAAVNCAGVMYPEAIVGSDMARWRELLAINVLALIEGSDAAIRRMREQRLPGHVINFGSLTARWDAGGVYGASKSAVEMVGRTLRKEIERDDIRVTTVVPGGFASELGRGFTAESREMLGKIIGGHDAALERMIGDPEHIASMVSYILQQPTAINLSEVVIRPPVSVEY